jgi:hypothetical protein
MSLAARTRTKQTDRIAHCTYHVHVAIAHSAGVLPDALVAGDNIGAGPDSAIAGVGEGVGNGASVADAIAGTGAAARHRARAKVATDVAVASTLLCAQLSVLTKRYACSGI